MKSKKIIASVAAMSVLAMSTMSFAAINLNNTNVTTLKLGGNRATNVVATGTTSVNHIEAITGAAKQSTITNSGIGQVSQNIEDKTPDVKQKCETLLYKLVA